MFLEFYLNWKLKFFVYWKKCNIEYLYNRLEIDIKLEFILNVNKVLFIFLKGDVLEVIGKCEDVREKVKL